MQDLLASIFDEKVVAILKSVLAKDNEFGIREVAREAGVSTATTYRIIQRLKDLRIIAKGKRGRNTSYTIIKNSDLYSQIYSLILGPKPDAITTLKEVLEHRFGLGNFEVITKGKDKDRKVIIVSDSIAEPIEISKEVYEKSGENLLFVSLSRLQYQQMKATGIL